MSREMREALVKMRREGFRLWLNQPSDKKIEAAAADFFTAHPRYRTKKRLAEVIKALIRGDNGR